MGSARSGAAAALLGAAVLMRGLGAAPLCKVWR